MKTMQELYDEILASQELKAQFVEAVKAGKQEAFLKEHGCGATMEEASAFLKTKTEEDTPLSLNELEGAAGGTCNDETFKETLLSVFAIVGFGCAIKAAASASDIPTDKGHVGQWNDKEGRLCNPNK